MSPDLLKALEARKEAIKRDDAAWWLRELEVANWSQVTGSWQVIERWVREIGERVRP